MYVRWVHCTKSNLKLLGKKKLKSPFHLLSKPQRICTSLKMLLTMSRHSLKLHTNRQFCQVPWFRWCHNVVKKNTTLDRTKKIQTGERFWGKHQICKIGLNFTCCKKPKGEKKTLEVVAQAFFLFCRCPQKGDPITKIRAAKGTSLPSRSTLEYHVHTSWRFLHQT